jgi:hypothetical protein
MKMHRLILVLPGLLTVLGCASGTQPVVPDGRDRVAANSPARINQLLTRISEDSAAQQERNALARQLDELNRQLIELKTFMFVMLARNEARGVDIAPVGVGRGPLTPAAPTVPQPAAPAGRSLLGLAPGETPVDDVPRPRQIAAAEGVPTPTNEPARKAPATRPDALGRPGPTKDAGQMGQPTSSAAAPAEVLTKKADTGSTPTPAASEPAVTDVKSAAIDAAVTEGPASSSRTLPQVVKSEPWVAAAGSSLRAELLRWAEKAGWKLIYDTETNYALFADVPMYGRFDEAAVNLVRLYETAKSPLVADVSIPQRLIYITNKPSN